MEEARRRAVCVPLIRTLVAATSRNPRAVAFANRYLCMLHALRESRVCILLFLVAYSHRLAECTACTALFETGMICVTGLLSLCASTFEAIYIATLRFSIFYNCYIEEMLWTGIENTFFKKTLHFFWYKSFFFHKN